MKHAKRSRPVDGHIFRQAAALLNKRERRQAMALLVLLIIGALSSALMVVSVLPFLTVLADPSMIDRIAPLSWIRTRFGLDDYQFIVLLGIGTVLVILLTNGIQLLKTYVLRVGECRVVTY